MIPPTHRMFDLSSAENKHTYGYHPVLAFCDNTNEALAGMLRPGNAGANTAVDHIALLDQALAQLPDEYRHGWPILVRTDGAGASKAFLATSDHCETSAWQPDSRSAGR
jgi:hypothetical protein